MKKVLLTLAISFILYTPIAVEAAPVKEVAKKWDAVTVAPDTNWGLVKANGAAATIIKPLTSSTSGAPVQHTFQFSCPTTTVVNLQITFNGITSVHTFNKGVALEAASGFQYSVILHKGMSYSIQHKTGTQACKVLISESLDITM